MKNETSHIHTAWIPSQFARLNKQILIDSMPGTWTIIECGATKDYSYVNEHSQDYKHAYPSIQDQK
jgi:hypothetical protein